MKIIHSRKPILPLLLSFLLLFNIVMGSSLPASHALEDEKTPSITEESLEQYEDPATETNETEAPDALPEKQVEPTVTDEWVEIAAEPYGPVTQGLLRSQEARIPPEVDKADWLLVTYDRPQGNMRTISTKAVKRIDRLQQISPVLDVVIPRPSQSKKDLMDELYMGPHVVVVEENQVFSIMSSVNDPYYTNQWHLTRTKAPETWAAVVASGQILSPVKVAVLDTGIQANHPDLSSRIASGGYNFINNSSNPVDGNGHGTVVSGIISASTNNGVGVASSAYTWPVSILPLKVINDSGIGSSTEVIAAINYAVQQGAHVINMSLGSNQYGGLLAEETAINNAVAAGVTIIAAAGNYGDSSLTYPASYTNVISVGATSNDAKNTRASFSNYNGSIDLVAPGVGIVSTQINSSYVSASGTSVSAPIVAGVAAVLKGLNSSLSPGEIKNIMTSTATDLGPAGKDNEYGWGLVDSLAAVNNFNVKPSLPAPVINSVTANKSGTVIPGTKISWTSNATGTGLTYYWRVYKDGVQVYSDTAYSSSKKSFSYKANQPGTYIARSYVRDYKWTRMVYKNSASIEVKDAPAPVIKSVTANKSGSVIPGTTIIWTSNATGTGLTYYWRVYKDGVQVYSDTAYSSSKKSFSYKADQLGTYIARSYVRDYKWTRMVHKNSASIEVKDAPAPVINSVTANKSGSVIPGTTITWTSNATGTGLTYYWRVYKDGVQVYSDTAYSSSKKCFSYKANKPGTYIARSYVRDYKWTRMVSKNSAAIKVEDAPAPVINSVTSNKSGPVVPGTTITWTSNAIGTGLTYYWRVYKDGVQVYSDTAYSSSKKCFSYKANKPGTYIARSYVRDYKWTRMVYKNSAAIKVEDAPAP